LIAVGAIIAAIVALSAREIAIAKPHQSEAGQAIDHSAFSPGACVAFPPTGGNRHLTVFLDAGHGGIDPGAVGTTESGQTIHEADETLRGIDRRPRHQPAGDRHRLGPGGGAILRPPYPHDRMTIYR
jgi:hypothetical protein